MNVKHHRLSRQVRSGLVGVLVGCLGVLTACDSTSAAGSSAIPSTPTMLTVAYCDPIEDLFESFTAIYPQVTIVPRPQDCSGFDSGVVELMTGENPPDLVQIRGQSLGDLVLAGGLLPLNSYEQTYDWGRKFNGIQLAQLQASADGRMLGYGTQYGIPAGGSFVGVYFNKALLATLGITGIPMTIGEFEATLRAVKEYDLTPIALGASDDGALYLWGSLVLAMAGVEFALSWVNGWPATSINDDPAIDAAQILADWASAGYFLGSPIATSQAQARAHFAQGSAVFLIDGSWALDVIPANDDFGFFAFPGADLGRSTAGFGSTTAFAISAGTSQPDLAAAFLDYLACAQAGATAAELGMLPVNADTAPEPSSGLQADLWYAYFNAARDFGIVNFFDSATPTMGAVLTVGLQGVLTGQTPAASFVESAQTNWEEYSQR